MKLFLIALFCLVAVSPAIAKSDPPSPAAVASPAATIIPADITAQAHQTYIDLITKKVDHSQFNDAMNALLTDAFVAKFATQLAPLGKPTAFEPIRQQTVEGGTAYVFRVTFADKEQLGWIFSLDAKGKIAGVYAKPINP